MRRLFNKLKNYIRADFDYDSAPYDSQKGVERLGSWYNVHKEGAFIDFLTRKGKPFGGVVLEVAGGEVCMVK
jgi:hypothetical protein